MLHFVYERPDGTVALVTPVRPLYQGEPAVIDPDTGKILRAAVPAETFAVYEAAVKAKAAPELEAAGGAEVGKVDTLPDDAAVPDWVETETGPQWQPSGQPRRFRNAWRWDAIAGALVHDAAALEAVRWANIRRIRDKLLAASDVELMKRRDQGKDTAAMASYRQALRDIPQTYADAASVQWPAKPA